MRWQRKALTFLWIGDFMDKKPKPRSGFLDVEPAIYDRFFKNVLRFEEKDYAEKALERLDSLYRYFEEIGDRAGQHQAMVLALTGMNKARWVGFKFSRDNIKQFRCSIYKLPVFFNFSVV